MDRWIVSVLLIFSYIRISEPFQGRILLGTIFDWDDKAAKSGFLFAMSRFNERATELFKLSAIVDSIDVDDSFQLVSSICKQMSTGVFMMYGARKFESSNIIQAYSQNFHIPYVSPSLSDNAPRTNPTYQLHMKPSHTKALVDLIIHYQWRTFHYVYDSGEGNNLDIQIAETAAINITRMPRITLSAEISTLIKQLSSRYFVEKHPTVMKNDGIVVSCGLFSLQEILRIFESTKYYVQVRMHKLQDIKSAHEDLRALDKQEEIDNSTDRYIVLDLSTENAYRIIMQQIREVGMNKEGYNYILGSLDFLNLDLERYQHDGVNITGFQLVNYSSSFVKEFIKDWKTLDPDIWWGAGNNSIHVEAALSIDAITVIQSTLDKLIANNPTVFQHTFRRGQVYNYNRTRGVPCSTVPPVPWMHGDSLMGGMKVLHFDGVTGNIEFDQYGFRRSYKMDVYNVGLNHRPSKIGEWSPKGGVYSDKEHTEISNDTDTDMTEKTYIVTSVAKPKDSPSLVISNEVTATDKSETTQDIHVRTIPGGPNNESKDIYKEVTVPYESGTTQDIMQPGESKNESRYDVTDTNTGPRFSKESEHSTESESTCCGFINKVSFYLITLTFLTVCVI